MATDTTAHDFATSPSAGRDDNKGDAQHAREVEEREAYEYWGYLFKSDKTGTDKLKSLLRALKNLINEKYETTDHPGQPEPDLTPDQLAHFYRDLHGNYDQLFLGTPHESIAFIYKSLGCLHSLQPAHHTHAIAFTDPTVPALKTEGWIMWQTIQLLLGPEEHAGFLREAVQVWDVKDPDTGELFPKILPRRCFPESPDRHMVAWYEGVSERLRREAEDEKRLKTIEVQHERDPPPSTKRRPHAIERRRSDEDDEDTGSLDSRAPALAYFRNPLYRHHDGRPSIVREHSKKPTVSPRPSILNKGKEAASSFGHIVRNVGSPHLWDGGRNRSDSANRDRRRRSNAGTPINGGGRSNSGRSQRSTSGGEGGPALGSFDSRLAPPRSSMRDRSSQPDRSGADNGVSPKEDRGNFGRESAFSARQDQSDLSPLQDERSPQSQRSFSRRSSRTHSRHASQELPRQKSHSHESTSPAYHGNNDEPEPGNEGEDYFTGYDDPARRHDSPSETRGEEGQETDRLGSDEAAAATTGAAAGFAAGAATAAAKNDVNNEEHIHENAGPPVGPSFEPSTSPLFAAHVSRQPQPFPPPQMMRPTSGAGMNRPPPPGAGLNINSPPPPSQFSPNPAIRRAQDDDPADRRYSNASPGRYANGPPPTHSPPQSRGNGDGRHPDYDRRPERPSDRRPARNDRPYDDHRPRSGSNRPFSPPVDDGRDRRNRPYDRDHDRRDEYEQDYPRDRHRGDRERRSSARLSAHDVSGGRPPSARPSGGSELSPPPRRGEPRGEEYSSRADRRRSGAGAGGRDYYSPSDDADDFEDGRDRRNSRPPPKQTRFAADPPPSGGNGSSKNRDNRRSRNYDDEPPRRDYEEDDSRYDDRNRVRDDRVRDDRAKEDLFDDDDEDEEAREYARERRRRKKSRSRSRREDDRD